MSTSPKHWSESTWVNIFVLSSPIKDYNNEPILEFYKDATKTPAETEFVVNLPDIFVPEFHSQTKLHTNLYHIIYWKTQQIVTHTPLTAWDSSPRCVLSYET